MLKDPTAKIIKCESGLKENIYTVELDGENWRVGHSLVGLLRFPESDLKHQNANDERDWKLKQLLS
jgi:hypothetical protein